MPKQSRPFMPRSAPHDFYPFGVVGAPLFAVCDGLPVDDVLEQVIIFIVSAQTLVGQCAELIERGEDCAQLAYSAECLLDMASGGVASVLVGLARSDAAPVSERSDFYPMGADDSHLFEVSCKGVVKRYPLQTAGADDSHLFEVRAGLPVREVLGQASCFISMAKTMANQCAELIERGEACAQLAYSTDSLLDMAKACANAALRGFVRGYANEEGGRA